MKGLIALALLVFGVIAVIPSDSDKPDEVVPVIPEPVKNDVLGESYKADRASKVALIRQLDSEWDNFSSDAEIVEWWNANALEARKQDFDPFLESFATALVQKRGKKDEVPADPEALKKLADSLE